MPGEVIDRPNPPALPSHIPKEVDKLFVQIDRKPLDKKVEDSLKKWQRTANYLAACKFCLAALAATCIDLCTFSHDLPPGQCAVEA
jgi:hypothetical protein